MPEDEYYETSHATVPLSAEVVEAHRAVCEAIEGLYRTRGVLKALDALIDATYHSALGNIPIWVCESGDFTFGAWRSVEAAIAAVKATYSAPYIVSWGEPEPGVTGDEKTPNATCWSLTGHFEAVPHYSTKHDGYFEFRPMTLEG